ncbi:MAG: response regulator [Candidatus Omnitrophota bacterium]
MDKKKILIIDDEQTQRILLTRLFEGAGHAVVQAEDGQKGFHLARDIKPDLIITDVLMPNMDGFTFFKELKTSDLTSNIPVLIITGRAKMEETFKVMGADDFILKPVKNEELMSTVERLLNHTTTVAARKKGLKRVLVVGEDSERVKNIVSLLEREGCHTDMVTLDAQVISKALVFLPDVIVIDILMEGLPSHTIIKVLRQMSEFEKIPMIGYCFYRLSDLESEGVQQKALNADAAEDACKKAGLTEYLGRFNENTFMKSIVKYLERQHDDKT